MADIIRKVDIEAWALRSLERLMVGPGKKRAEEDNRVEFLAGLPPVEKAAENARQLAGYLNAARSEPLLWILGVEAKSKKLNGQVTLGDFEQWWQAVARHFEGLAPFYTLVPIANQETLLVHEREAAPCLTCGTAIVRLVVGQRSAYYCPQCQPDPDPAPASLPESSQPTGNYQ